MLAFTTDEKREFVLDYLQQRHGSKTAWLQDKPFSLRQLARWRSAYLHGDLDRDLVPRKTRGMTSHPARLEDLEKLLTQQQREHDAQLAELHEENSSLRAANDALGKAIGLMHKWSEHTPDDTPTPPEPPSS